MSDLRVNTISASDGTSPVTLTKQSAAKVWFLYNGGGTPAFRGSFNASSLTDVATGDHAVNFTNSMSDVDYSLSGAIGDGSDRDSATANLRRGSSTTSAQRNTANYAAGGTNGLADYTYIGGSIHGDLA